ncbi:MAG: hypothetical protein HQL56_19630 [Magnetococcales bacterium]|nr:hypothetical protein [Magnetococcales bacterium]
MSYRPANLTQAFQSFQEELQNGPETQPAIPEWRRQQQREDNQVDWVTRRAETIRKEKGWSDMDPAAEVQATFDSHEHQRQYGDAIWDYPGGMPPEAGEEDIANIPTRSKRGNPAKVRMNDLLNPGEEETPSLLSDPHFDRALKRLALAQVQRENPGVDFSFLEPETRDNSLFGDNGFVAKLRREMPGWGFSSSGAGWGQNVAMNQSENTGEAEAMPILKTMDIYKVLHPGSDQKGPRPDKDLGNQVDDTLRKFAPREVVGEQNRVKNAYTIDCQIHGNCPQPDSSPKPE